MSRDKPAIADGVSRSRERPVSLKQLSTHLGLSPTALSLVLNGSPAADSIPQETKDRIFAAAKEFNYRPNYLARALRVRRTHTIGVLVPDLSGYSGAILAGIQEQLAREGYWYILASHGHDDEMIERQRDFFLERGTEGLIAVDTPCAHGYALPAVAVSRHDRVEGVTNIVLNHERAATEALRHLADLGHRRIAFVKGQSFSSDTEARWRAIERATRELGIKMPPALCVQLEGNTPSPEVGYAAARRLLERGESFTALFSFNDVSAIGAIRLLREAGRRVPEDVSVVGFDDVDFAAYQHPALTTVRQPLFEMGRVAAETIVKRIAGKTDEGAPEVVLVEPELVVRGSSCPVGQARRDADG